MADKKYISSSMQRRRTFSLPMEVYKMYLVDMFLHYRSESEHGAFIIKKYYGK